MTVRLESPALKPKYPASMPELQNQNKSFRHCEAGDSAFTMLEFPASPKPRINPDCSILYNSIMWLKVDSDRIIYYALGPRWISTISPFPLKFIFFSVKLDLCHISHPNFTVYIKFKYKIKYHSTKFYILCC